MAALLSSQYSKFLLLSYMFFICYTSSSSSLRHDFSIVGYSTDDLNDFESWIETYGKNYKTDEEKNRRLEIFEENKKYIDQRNKEIRSYSLGLNEFSDLSYDEFWNRYLGTPRKPAEFF